LWRLQTDSRARARQDDDPALIRGVAHGGVGGRDRLQATDFVTATKKARNLNAM